MVRSLLALGAAAALVLGGTCVAPPTRKQEANEAEAAVASTEPDRESVEAYFAKKAAFAATRHEIQSDLYNLDVWLENLQTEFAKMCQGRPSGMAISDRLSPVIGTIKEGVHSLAEDALKSLAEDAPWGEHLLRSVDRTALEYHNLLYKYYEHLDCHYNFYGEVMTSGWATQKDVIRRVRWDMEHQTVESVEKRTPSEEDREAYHQSLARLDAVKAKVKKDMEYKQFLIDRMLTLISEQADFHQRSVITHSFRKAMKELQFHGLERSSQVLRDKTTWGDEAKGMLNAAISNGKEYYDLLKKIEDAEQEADKKLDSLCSPRTRTSV